MIRILFFLLIVFIVLILLARILRFHKKQQQKTLKQGQKLVPCAYCKRYLPVQHAVAMDKKHFCNLDHYQKYQKDAK